MPTSTSNGNNGHVPPSPPPQRHERRDIAQVLTHGRPRAATAADDHQTSTQAEESPDEDSTAAEQCNDSATQNTADLCLSTMMRRWEHQGIDVEDESGNLRRLHRMIEFTIAYGLSLLASIATLLRYAERYPFPFLELTNRFIEEQIEYVEQTRDTTRGQALQLDDIKVTCGQPDRYGKREVVITSGENSHSSYFDPRIHTPLRVFCDTALSELGLHYAAVEELADLVRAEAKRRPLVEKFTFGELRRQHPALRPPVINGLFREGETVNIVTHSKAGKSWSVYDLALSIITGTPWLGPFATSAGNVLLIDNELHKETLAYRVPIVAEERAIDPEEYECGQLEVWPLRGRLCSLTELSDEFDAIAPGTFKVVILDSKYRFIPPGTSENDNAAEAQLYNLIDMFAERIGSSFVLIHHVSKGEQGDKRVTDVGAGAGAQSRAADCHIVLREHEEPGVVVLEAAVRSFPPVEPLALRWQFPLWVPADDVNPSQLRGRLTRRQLRQQDQDRTGMQAILEALAAGPARPNALTARTGLSRDRLQRLLDMLTADHRIVSVPVVASGNQSHEYSLP